MSRHPAPWDIYIYTYLYISSVSPTSFYPFFSLFFPARRGKNYHDFSFQTSILQVKRPRLVPSRCLWFKVRLEPLFLIPPGKFVAANECFKKVAHVPAARALVLSPGEGFGESQQAASSESEPRYHCRVALLPAFLALSIPLRNKQDRLDKKKKIKKEKKSYDQNGSLLRVFFFIASSSYSSSSGTCCKERELRVWILHLGKGKVVRHRGTPDLFVGPGWAGVSRVCWHLSAALAGLLASSCRSGSRSWPEWLPER